MKQSSHLLWLRGASLLLAAVLAAALFAGCKQEEGTTSSAPKSSAVLSSEAPTEEIESYQEKSDPWLPETADLGGKEITFALPAGSEGVLLPEEGESAEGDLLLETIRQTQTKYNCKIAVKSVTSPWDQDVMTSLLAGDMYANVLMPCVHECGQFLSARLCADYLEESVHQYIHMEEPWWNNTMAYASNVQGSVYAGACNIHSYADDTFVIFFNKRILKEIGSSDTELYKMYKDKTWNWDAFRALVKKGVKDLDNDGKMTVEDQWGFGGAGYDSVEAFLSSANLGSIVTTDGKNPTYNYATPFALSTMTTLNEIYTVDGGFCLDAVGKRIGDGSQLLYHQMFFEGKLLFLIYRMECCSTQGMREMADEHGVMPMPLGPSEKGGWQTEYASRVDHNFRLCLIPATNTDLSDTALVLESVAFDCWKIVNKKNETYGSLYFSDDDAAEIVFQMYNYSHFEISQFLYSVLGGQYRMNVMDSVIHLYDTPYYDVSGAFSSVATAAQEIIDEYFAGN